MRESRPPVCFTLARAVPAHGSLTGRFPREQCRPQAACQARHHAKEPYTQACYSVPCPTGIQAPTLSFPVSQQTQNRSRATQHPKLTPHFNARCPQDAAAKRAMTVADFFAQYPALHPFLLAQLQLATEQLEQGGMEGGAMHPSLFPVLALLARLRWVALAWLTCWLR